MNRIIIDRRIDQYAKDFEVALRNDKPNVLANLANLKNDIAIHSGLPAAELQQYLDYIDAIITDYGLVAGTANNLIILKPSQFATYKAKYDAILPESKLSTTITYGVYGPGAKKAGQAKKKKFYELLSDRMHYSDGARSLMIPYIDALNIKTCVYCNIQYAITTSSGKGYYQLDHRMPQSKYPFLCTSFYNFQPSCADCNREKNDDASDFGLFLDNSADIQQPFHLLTNPKTYLKKRKLQQSDIDIKLLPSDVHNRQLVALCAEHEKLFDINARYAMLKDVAEETIWKCKSYDGTYKTLFLKNFPELYDKDALHRFIFGTYADPNNVHARPLSKLIQDIEKDMGVVITP